MVCVYGMALENETSALSLVRMIRKGEPRVSLLAALSDDERGLGVIDSLVSGTILFDPATIFPGETTPACERDLSKSAARLLKSAEITDVLDTYSDIKAFVFSPEAVRSESLFSEGMKAVCAAAVKPVTVTIGECSHGDVDLIITQERPSEIKGNTSCLILSEHVLVKGEMVINLPTVTDAASAITLLSQREVFGSVLDSPELYLNRL